MQWDPRSGPVGPDLGLVPDLGSHCIIILFLSFHILPNKLVLSEEMTFLSANQPSVMDQKYWTATHKISKKRIETKHIEQWGSGKQCSTNSLFDQQMIQVRKWSISFLLLNPDWTTFPYIVLDGKYWIEEETVEAEKGLALVIKCFNLPR